MYNKIHFFVNDLKEISFHFHELTDKNKVVDENGCIRWGACGDFIPTYTSSLEGSFLE